MSSRRRLAVGAGLVMAGAASFEVFARARTPNLCSPSSGDSWLIREAEAILRRSHGPRGRASIAVIDDGVLREAHFGADRHTQYEIGSITKTMTAAVFADMVERGEISRRALLGAFLELEGSEVAAVELEELATYTSGLPDMASTWRNFAGLVLWPLLVHDPSSSVTLERLVVDARRSRVGPKEYAYSNLGYSLLGQALARHSRTTFPRLLEERLFAPLGMVDSFVPADPRSLPADAPRGYSIMWGRRAAPWTLGAEAPSGSVRSTLADMTRYLQALLDGTAPGASALEPAAVVDGSLRIGYGWHIDQESLVWHNGMTGGFSSWMSLCPGRGRGVVVLSNTMNSVDELGRKLAGSSSGASGIS